MKINKLWSIMMMLVIMLGTAVAFSSCSKDDDGEGTKNESTDNNDGEDKKEEADLDVNNPKETSVTSIAKVIDYQSVVLKGYANNAVGKVGFCYSATNTSPTPENSEFIVTSVINADNSYELTIKELIPNTQYYYRAFATVGEAKIMAKEVWVFTTGNFVPEAIDMGLSVKWANCNIGAEYPEDCGDYFAWGETVGYKSGKTVFSTSNYKWFSDSRVTKYNTSERGGIVDNKIILEPEDDAATANWGNKWRMPTKGEFDELCKNTTTEHTTRHGINCMVFISKINGNSITMPLAGYRKDDMLTKEGKWMCYWTSSLDALYGGGLLLDIENKLPFQLADGAVPFLTCFPMDYDLVPFNGRYLGLSVRAVCK